MNNLISTTVNVFYDPSRTVNSIKGSPSLGLMPFILTSLFLSIASYVYYTNVDLNFLIDQQLLLSGSEYSKNEYEIAKNQMLEMADYQHWFVIGGGIFWNLLVAYLLGGYLSIVSKIDARCNLKYGDWVSLALWSILPSVFLYVGSIILALTAETNQISLSILNFLSLNQLIFNMKPTEPFFNLLESINVFTFWSIYIVAVGLSEWTNISKSKAMLLSAAPWSVIFITWVAIA